jgi:RNA polymerase sigma-70 factor (ECF subfamily)
VGPHGDDASTDEAERTLVEQARMRSADAFAVLYRTHVGPIYQFLLRRSRSQEVAEEVTSATFEKAWRAIDGFEWRPGGFGGWLHRIAANELVEYYRAMQRDATPRAQRTLGTFAATGSDGGPEDEDYGAAERARLARALTALPPRYQEAISVRYLAGLTTPEAAAVLGCTRGGLAVLCHRALGALRKEFDGQPRAGRADLSRLSRNEREEVG